MSRKRVLVISDQQTGHDLGLTHPSDDFDDGTTHYLVRRRIWEWYAPLVKRLVNGLWAARGEYPLADVIIRSHVHYHNFCGGSDWLAMTTPALQGYGSKYGARRCTGLVDVGMVHFDIWSKERWEWKAEILRFPAAEPLEA